jgi:putative aldouronate transport system substrate-binding protein
MKKLSKFIGVFVAGTLLFSACTPAGGGAAGDAPTAADTPAATADTPAAADTAAANGERPEPPEGPDTNNGRPFNRTPMAWDNRDTTRFLHGVNLTILPIVEEPQTIEIWRGFSSTVISGFHESEPFIEAEARTNVLIDWFAPPVGQATENFMMRIAADDLPHVFSNPPAFPGGPAAAVEQGVYLDLTPYYNMGWLPNYRWLRAYHPIAEEIRRGTTDDLGRVIGINMLDIVPSHPWSGLWIRQDYLDNLGLDTPTTIDEWDYVLRTFRDYRGSWVLGHNLYQGVQTNFAFVGSFGAGFRRWLDMDGTVGHGSIQPGFEDYLRLMNRWLADGIMDPDFFTKEGADFYASVASHEFLAFDLAYGGLGQQLLTGRQFNPDMAVTPLPNPAPAPGVPVRISSQNNSIIRGDRSFVTDRTYADGNLEVVLRWLDYWYSQDGGDLGSYGIFGHTSQWNDDGEIEWIHPIFDDPHMDFWTPVLLFKVRPFSFLRDSTAYDNVPEVWECIRVWGAADNSWIMATDLTTLTPDEASEMAGIMADVDTHILEQSLLFITGARSLDQFDQYLAELESMNIRRAEEIQQASLERFHLR